MPNWTDDEGRCCFDVDGVPCHQSGTGCPMHRVEPTRKRKKTLQQDAVAAAFKRGVAAMRQAILDQFDWHNDARSHDRVRALPDPEDK